MSVWSYDHNHGDMRTMRPRRAAWYMRHQKPLPQGHRVYVTCGNWDCCNPDHVTNRSVAQEGARIRRTGEARGQTKRILAARATGRKRTKLTPEVLARIESSAEPGCRLAAELGLSATTVSKVRLGRVIASARPASPWDGLTR
jgi:hypothetical protein